LLTDSKIKAFLRDLKSNNPNGLKTDVRLTDGAGLNLLIRKSGSIIWRFDYPRPITKKRNTMSIGVYPQITLAKVQEYRDQFRALIAEGKDPQLHYLAHFIMIFDDINKYVIPFNSPKDQYEKIINIHTKEDAHHWPWYIHDLKALGFDQNQRITQTLEFLLAEKLAPSRELGYKSISLLSNQPAIIKYIVSADHYGFLKNIQV